MRTRSSRFFVILVHLVGVSHPSWMSDRSSGIVAVLPWPVALERIDLYYYQDEEQHQQHLHKRRRSGISISSSHNHRNEHKKSDDDDDVEEAKQQQPPVWLQDSADGSCLGPTGTFSECGDATLWFVERQKLPASDKLKLLSGTGGFGTLFGGGGATTAAAGGGGDGERKSPSSGLIFRVVDRDYEASSSSSSDDSSRPVETRRQRRKRLASAECLDADPRDSSVEVLSCRRRGGFVWQPKVRSSVWVVNEEGVLQPASSRTKKNGASLCLARGSENQAILANCEERNPVQFSFLRYRAVAVSASAAAGRGSSVGTDEHLKQATASTNSRSTVALEGPYAFVTNMPPYPSDSPSESLPVNRDRAHSHASGPSMHPELKLASRLLFADQRKSSEARNKNKMRLPFDVLSDTNPILLAGSNAMKQGRTTPPPAASLVHPTKDDIRASIVRRMQTHPYINEAKNEIWTDPQTGLQYHTDLCKYLGRDRKEHGRHTLTGVGIYRKGFVIKVYGIAYYVSKRDVLADPSFSPFASMTADQLRTRQDFYEILRKMGNREAGRERVFDRTIMLKTNMQLSAETMRSSLQADWSYLTDEAKSTLVGVSMKARPAEDEMLALIQSPDNPSRCSCSQVAPPEYNANPECCARGTELVFTWTKANELEVRLNGRLMETFPRPDIAEGIFYEYLRYDDPISPELRDRVVDGFPFLLGPLAQVRGISIGQTPQPKAASHSNSVLMTMTGFKDAFASLAMEMAGTAKRSATEAAEHAGNASKAVAAATKEFAIEADRRRDLMVKHTVAAPATLMKLMARDEETIRSISRWMSGEPDEPDMPDEEESLNIPTRRAPRGRVFGYPLSRWFGEDYYAPDEIGPMKIHPTINKIILALVHLYLLLLFIVSFPGSYSTRTKLLIRKSCASQEISDDSESDTSEEIGKTCVDGVTEIKQSGKERLVRHGPKSARWYGISRNRNPSLINELLPDQAHHTDSGLKKKSLSYFL